NFAQNPFPNAVNGSLWTLSYEVTCYVVLALAGLCGMYRNGRFPAFLIGFAMIYGSIELGIINLSKAYAYLSLPFFFGMAVYHFRRHVPLAWPIALGLLVVAIAIPAD